MLFGLRLGLSVETDSTLKLAIVLGFSFGSTGSPYSSPLLMEVCCTSKVILYLPPTFHLASSGKSSSSKRSIGGYFLMSLVSEAIFKLIQNSYVPYGVSMLAIVQVAVVLGQEA